jgi:hypothetical protein
MIFGGSECLCEIDNVMISGESGSKGVRKVSYGRTGRHVEPQQHEASYIRGLFAHEASIAAK